jgi:methyl-accepting chemotaxis protein
MVAGLARRASFPHRVALPAARLLRKPNMLSRLNIGPRLGLGFAAVLAAFVALWTLAAINIEHARGLSDAVTRRHDQTSALAQAHGAVLTLRAGIAQALATSDAATRQRLAADTTATRRKFGAALFDYRQSGDQATQEDALLRDLEAAYARMSDARVRSFELLQAGNDDEARKLAAETLEPASAQAMVAVEQLIALKDKEVAAADDYYALELKRSTWFIHVVGVLSLGAAAVIIWILARSITVPLREAVAAIETVARGDLTREVVVRSRDEVGQLLLALQTMQRSLRELVGDVVGGAESVADASAQIAQGNVDLSQRTEEQASTLEETASSMEELTATVNQNADNAKQAKQLAANASEVAGKGGEVVGDVVRTMNGISASSRQIADIIGVIDGIAFQTNILALNAAVEAARAGEQGRGFAVVAAEVRSLAQRSASAAKEIKELIGGSVGQVEAGTKLVHDAGVTMQEIVASVQKVSELVADIAAASQEQSQGIAQVTTAVSQMDQVVQQNATLVEEATAATESMKQQAAALVRAVSRFRIGEGEAQQQAVPAEPLPPQREESVQVVQSSIRFVPARKTPPAAPEELRHALARPHNGNGEWKEF